MRARFILEWKLFIQNVKNQLVFFLFLFLSLYAVFMIEANYTPWRPVDADIFESEIEDAQAFIANNDESLNPRMYGMFSDLIDQNTQLLEAIEAEDWQQVIEKEQNHYLNFVRLRYGEGGSYRDPYFYSYDEPGYISDIQQDYADGYIAKRYQDYQTKDQPLSQSIIEERTVIQTLLRYMQNWLPAILIIMAILYAVDVIPKDKKHPSILQTSPLSSYKVSWIKSLVVLLAYGITLLTGFLLFADRKSVV